ncbi:MAG: hypothetical protein HY720_17985 [Planctomycetes bacterium]|nr:hypothetical protein [Planctomycetota bacterium]
MARKFAWMLVAAMVVLVSGCFTLNARHNRNHLKATSNDFTRLHADVDRHFWNYDWEDPHDY